MPEPLKNLLHPALILSMAGNVAEQFSGFDRDRFVKLASKDINQLELMQRALQIRDALVETLPDDFEQAAAILSASLPQDRRTGITGWALLPVSQFVAQKGLGHFDLSLELLKKLTPHFTAEFGIRPFIHADQDRALKTIGTWASHPNHHVRRLASEGTRPRLPWAMRLPALMRDPQPILPILTALLDDPQDYVRRSIANSLNDIAKDHPALVAAFVGEHIGGASPERKQLLRHASRTLLKKGDTTALANFGFAPSSGISAVLAVDTEVVMFGGALAFSLSLTNENAAPQQLMIDYAVHHQKANGTLAPKVFKWKSLTLKPGKTLVMARSHAMRAITTRQYYPGAHRVEILVNGAVLAGGDFTLTMN
ncbi:MULTISPECIES: DNA alkylation repair protein [unclassified Rhizobium]|uniref:DNA alkylation repair protein n=1 Tax=unclassified Rhizobium TaxID=2613769 RepID=UPI000713F980|nr:MULTISPECIES: DNA alkylation repair protein [unclassified Rhizobium]KQS99225.1 DNA alkylation repair protein [Rhizobium sp. Leaf386]KQT05301.1 DNA alkylation repair protein [Rhizobium sp. Leaf391]KQT91743.1 DNA alkylation repair protein [Rhizobium sp. Leaf453]